MVKHKILYIFLLIFAIFGDDLDGGDLAQCIAEERCDDKETGLVIIPFLFYSSETNVGAGASFVRYSKIKNLDHKPDQYLGNMILTLKKQLSLIAYTDQYSYDDKKHFFSLLEFKYYPDKFFGIGPDAQLDYEESYTPIYFNSENSLTFMLFDDLYIGPAVKLQYADLLDITDSQMLDTMDIPGDEGVFSLNTGIKLAYDTRDNSFYPTAGVLAEGLWEYSSDLNYKNLDYSELNLDFKQYFGLGGRHVVAYQLYGVFQNGNSPFQFMPKLGGASVMRGYYEGRYRDKNMLSAQLEYRFPLFWKLGGVAFLNSGQVAEKYDEFNIDTFNTTGGLGLRFLLIKEQGLNIRLDFGYSEDGLEFYITAMEAF